ncbi:MAG: hypothetical protein AAGU04_09070 [Anaerolineaceae bacterium]
MTSNPNQNRLEYAHKPAFCPLCGSTLVAEILWDLPAFSEELQKDLEAGKIVLCGYCVIGDEPTWQCADCGTDFYRKPA